MAVLLRNQLLQRLLLQLRRALQEGEPQRDRGGGQQDREALDPELPRQLGNSCGEIIGYKKVKKKLAPAGCIGEFTQPSADR